MLKVPEKEVKKLAQTDSNSAIAKRLSLTSVNHTMAFFLRIFLSLHIFLICLAQQGKAELLNGDFEIKGFYLEHWSYSGGVFLPIFAGPLLSCDPVTGFNIVPPELPAIDGTSILFIAQLDEASLAIISQSANYSASQNSHLSFYAALKSQEISITSGHLTVFWDNSIVLEQDMSGDNALSNADWIHFSRSIDVTEGIHTLTLAYITHDGFPLSNIYLDAISVPEPTSLALLSFVGLTFLFRKIHTGKSTYRKRMDCRFPAKPFILVFPRAKNPREIPFISPEQACNKVPLADVVSLDTREVWAALTEAHR